jgi:8-hydroxy-5-deazaflavin:NADPH oxidoreductase
MHITIIGAGNMGRGIGTRLVSGGHSVTFEDVNPEAAEKAAAEVKKASKRDAQVSTAPMDSADLSEIVVLAVWYDTNLEVARQLGSRLAGKVVVDIANPQSTFDGLAIPPDSSSAEELEKVVASSAQVVKAFNTTFAGTLVAGQVAGQPLDVFIAGDDAEAKAKVAKLVKDGGLRPIDAGPLSRSRQLEAMQLLHIVLQKTLGTNYGSTIKILS